MQTEWYERCVKPEHDCLLYLSSLSLSLSLCIPNMLRIPRGVRLCITFVRGDFDRWEAPLGRRVPSAEDDRTRADPAALSTLGRGGDW